MLVNESLTQMLVYSSLNEPINLILLSAVPVMFKSFHVTRKNITVVSSITFMFFLYINIGLKLNF